MTDEEKIKKQESIAKHEKAKTRIEKVLLKWFVDDPLMFGMYNMVDKTPDKTQESLGINTKHNPPKITYNPNFVNALSEEVLETVLASEGFKLLLRHPTSRLLFPENISSISSNVTVNQTMNHNFSKIEGLDIVEDFSQEMGLERNQYFEEYFRNIMDQSDKALSTISQMWGSLSEEQKNEVKKEVEKMMEGPETDEDGYAKFDSASDALKNYTDPNATANKDWKENSLVDADVDNYVKQNKGSAKQWGTWTGRAMDDIIVANTSKISYKELLRRFNQTVTSTKSVSSRMKQNRRYDLASPGYRREYQSKVIFAIDTSGSMSDDDLKEGMASCNSILKHSEVEYILFDTEITHIEKNYRKAKKTFKAHGRGGTDFQEVIDYTNERVADGLIIFTDGYASAPTRPRGTKVLWLFTDKDCTRPGDITWGATAVLDRYEK